MSAFDVLNSRKIIIALIAISISFRLFNATEPFLDHHSWRQTQTLSIARNFYTIEPNLLNPRVDWMDYSEDTYSGVVRGIEFQIVPYALSLVYFFLYNDLIARAVTVVFSVATLSLFYSLVKRYDSKLALSSTLVFSIAPIYLFFSRTFIQEIFVLFFMVASISFMHRYTDSGRKTHLLLSTVFSIFMLLVKITSFPFLLVNIFLLFKKNLRKEILAYLLISAIPAIIFYGATYFMEGVYFPVTQIVSDQNLLLDPTFYIRFLERLSTSVLNPLGALFLLLGLVTYSKDKLFHFILVSFFVYLFVFGYGNHNNTYYQLLIMPTASFFIASGIERIGYRPALLMGFMLVSVYYTIPMYSLLYSQSFMQDYGSLIRSNSGDGDLVVTSSNGNPALLYM
jgi:hypothetical protein